MLQASCFKPPTTDHRRRDMATTVLVHHSTKAGTTAKGTWVLNTFKANDGTEYQTFDAALASQALALMGQPVEIEFTPEERGNFVNNTIVGIAASTQTTPILQQTYTAPPTVAEIKPVDRNAGIARAIETFGVAGVDPLENQDALFELADVYATYGALGVKPKTASAVPTV